MRSNKLIITIGTWLDLRQIFSTNFLRKCMRSVWTICIHIYLSGLLIICGKKIKISWDFQGQIRGKIGQFRRIFAGKKSKFVEKLADFAGFSREKSQISKDFQGQVLRKIGRFHGKFQGETSPRNNQ